jgi:hypothetical protein
MSGEITPLPTPVKPGDTFEQKHIDLMITTLSQLRAAAPAFREEQFGCDGILCICDGDDDCINMFKGDDCGPNAQCWTDETGFHCVCLQ